ncbi:hypothetical protein RJ640_001696 [Escallonia rubra]|uniref:Uncharacterized protein n=1 Tax=Escallonia rubra TaxID=112253 RepID=A0AA88QZG8_9ASTE|nr:hypothetical protein RJ640_001696 [Escallonia rubra]
MATEATSNFQNPDLISVPYPSDFHAKITALAAHDGLHFWRFLIVGSIAGMVEHMAMFSIDLIKTRMQALSWIGITCSKGRRVTAVNLLDTGLKGTIPKEVGNLTSLVFLNISNNSLQGHMPAEMRLLHQLQYMSLQFNKLSGEIPSSLSRCWKLRQLSLNGNKFNGSIPGKIGELPKTVFNISSLVSFDILDNEIAGSLPADLCYLLPMLERIGIGQNQFTGEIPPSPPRCASLQFISLTANKFTGIIPSLRQLVIGSNRLHGVLPNSVRNLSASLELLDTTGCHINGTIPREIGNLSNLVALGLRDNDLTGSILETIGKL